LLLFLGLTAFRNVPNLAVTDNLVDLIVKNGVKNVFVNSVARILFRCVGVMTDKNV
jgi:hypothetical protein